MSIHSLTKLYAGSLDVGQTAPHSEAVTEVPIGEGSLVVKAHSRSWSRSLVVKGTQSELES